MSREEFRELVDRVDSIDIRLAGIETSIKGITNTAWKVLEKVILIGTTAWATSYFGG